MGPKMSETPKGPDRPTEVRTRSDGTLECVYKDNHEIVWVQKRGERAKYRREVMNPRADVELTKELGEQICEKLLEGHTLTSAARALKIPPKYMYKWRMHYKWFRDDTDQAMRDRAHAFHDEALEEARKEHSKAETPSAKLKIETLKWAAERGDPERFAPRSTVHNKEERTLRLIVITGVPAPDEPKEVPSDVREGGEYRLLSETPSTPGSPGDEAVQRPGDPSPVWEDGDVPEPHGGSGPPEPA